MTTTWCERNWHDGACCPGSIRQWHLQRDLLPPEPEPHGLDTAAEGWSWSVPAHDRGDHSACDRNCEHTL